MNFEKIVTKYNYSEEFSEFFKDVYNGLINYFGNEELVFNALYNTKIVSVKNVYDYFKENDLLEKDDSIVQVGDLRRCSGVYQCVPEIIYDENALKYKIINTKRVVAIVNFDINSSNKKATLIHELCHLIKSYYNENSIEDNRLISRSGLIESIYELQVNNGVVQKKLIKEVGVGLEEGFTSVAEEEISRKIVDKEYNSSGYGVVNAIARNLLKINKMEEIIINAEIYHDYNELFTMLDVEDFYDLVKITDKIYELVLLMFSQIFEQEKMQETVAKINEILTNYYLPLDKKIQSNVEKNTRK